MLDNATFKTFIPTVKPEAAKAFYRDILGLTLLAEDDYGIDFDADGTLMRLIVVPQLNPQTFTIMGWNVLDIEKSIHELNSKGLKFEKYNLDFMQQDELGIWTSPDGTKVAWFKDLDGNVLSLSQPAASV